MGESDITKKSRKRRGKKTITFDQETVTKSLAEKLVSEHNSKQVTEVTNEVAINKKRRKRNKKGKEVNDAAGNQTNDNDIIISDGTKKSKVKKIQQNISCEDGTNTEDTKKPKKRKRKTEKSDSLRVETQEELDPKKPEIKGEESIRAKKRRKYNELVKQRKLTQELDMQQKCLNYLSQWKHNRNAWKFEKLKQVWLQTHLYDDTRLPNEFWDTAVEYFNGSKGVVRGVILKEALGILEKEGESMEVDENDDDKDAGDESDKDKSDEDDKDNVKDTTENESKVKYSRARSIVQSLQE